VVEAWETEGGVRPSASWQAVTCVNAETAPKDTMRRPTLPGLGEGWHGTNALDDESVPLRRGGGRQHVNKEQQATREAPPVRACDPQPDSREGQAGLVGVAEGLVVPSKPGNSGGGKEPRFQGADEAAREQGD